MNLSEGIFTICGDSVTIERKLSGEFSTYALLQGSVQPTKPFQIEIFQEAKFPPNCGILAGDLIRRNSDRQYFLTTSANKEAVFNSSEYIQSVLYKCNTSGEVQRFRITRTYATEPPAMNWYSASSGIVWGVIDLFNLIAHDSGVGDISSGKWNLWLQNSVDIQSKDRFTISGEKYIVKTVDTVRFPNLKFVELDVDTR